MIRMWPGSLFGRLIIILVIGLILAQLISVVIFWRDRGRAIDRSAGLELTHRIADTIELLDPLDMGERERMVRYLSRPRLKVRLLEEFHPLRAKDYQSTGISRYLTAALHQQLDNNRPIQVVSRIDPGAGSRRGSERAHRGWPAAPRVSFLAVIGLTDGAGVRFRFRLPHEAVNRPVRLLIWIGVLLGSVIVLALVAVRQTTRPLNALAAAADELGHNINRPPLPERGPGEVRRAARAFNAMQQRIQQFIRERTHLLAAISHDLKTPITRLRLRTEMLDDEQLKTKFDADLIEMEVMIDETLEFMRGIANQEATRPVSIGALLESLHADAQDRGASFDLDVGDLAPYPAQPIAIKRCITNLIDNAIKYADRVVVKADDTGRKLKIIVTDNGPGIPESELPRVFEPFYRVEKSRSRETGGAGMGLAVAQAIARSHGGEIRLQNLPAGGLQASLELPRAAGSVGARDA